MGKKDKENANGLALKAGILYVIAELVTRGISFLTTPVFTRLLPATVFADVKIFESWTYLLAPVISISLYHSVSRAKFDFGDHYKNYVSSIIVFMASLTVGIGFIGLGIKEYLSDFLGFNPMLLFLMLLYCFSYNSIQCFQMKERQLLHYKSNIMLTILAVVPAVIISVFCVIKYRNLINDSQLMSLRLVSFYLPTTIIGFIVALIAIKQGKTGYNKKYWSYGVHFSFPMMIFTLATQVLYQSDKIMIKWICGNELTAIFALASTVGYIMDILVHAVDNAWRPWLFERLNMKEYSQVRKFWLCLIILMGTLTWITVIIAPELVLFLGGKQYKDAVWLISPIVCGAFANFIIIGYTGLEQFYKKTKCTGYASAITAVVNISLNYVCIKMFGYQAAAYTTAISYLIAAFIHYKFVIVFEKEDVLAGKKTFLIWTAITSICLASMILYNLSFLVRWGILLLTCFIFLGVFRNRLLEILNVFRNR